jgi:hypothetical protein
MATQWQREQLSMAQRRQRPRLTVATTTTPPGEEVAEGATDNIVPVMGSRPPLGSQEPMESPESPPPAAMATRGSARGRRRSRAVRGEVPTTAAPNPILASFERVHNDDPNSVRTRGEQGSRGGKIRGRVAAGGGGRGRGHGPKGHGGAVELQIWEAPDGWVPSPICVDRVSPIILRTWRRDEHLLTLEDPSQALNLVTPRRGQRGPLSVYRFATTDFQPGASPPTSSRAGHTRGNAPLHHDCGKLLCPFSGVLLSSERALSVDNEAFPQAVHVKVPLTVL